MLAKKRGPPPSGKGVQVVVRLQPDPLGQIDKWIANQPDHPTRAEAIRRLVEMALQAQTPKAKPSERLRAVRASELAARTIEKIIDPAAPPEVRAERHRRLTKGPSEFREDRIDQPKAKGK